MRVAVLGGTFNPIHLGHLRVAEEAREAFGLDRVVFMPANIPPHKADPDPAPARLRLDMERLIIGSAPFNDITTWREYEELMRLVSLIIVSRPGYPVKKPAEALPVEL